VKKGASTLGEGTLVHAVGKGPGQRSNSERKNKKRGQQVRSGKRSCPSTEAQRGGVSNFQGVPEEGPKEDCWNHETDTKENEATGRKKRWLI